MEKNNNFDKRFDRMEKKFDERIGELTTLVEGLAMSVARGFEKNEADHETIKRDVSFMRANFVNREEFDALARRVVFLERRIGVKK